MSACAKKSKSVTMTYSPRVDHSDAVLEDCHTLNEIQETLAM
jgi:hypothetical protein